MNACKQTHHSLGNNFLTLTSPWSGLDLVFKCLHFIPLLMCVALVIVSLGVKYLLNTRVCSMCYCHLVTLLLLMLRLWYYIYVTTEEAFLLSGNLILVYKGGVWVISHHFLLTVWPVEAVTRSIYHFQLRLHGKVRLEQKASNFLEPPSLFWLCPRTHHGAAGHPAHGGCRVLSAGGWLETLGTRGWLWQGQHPHQHHHHLLQPQPAFSRGDRARDVPMERVMYTLLQLMCRFFFRSIARKRQWQTLGMVISFSFICFARIGNCPYKKGQNSEMANMFGHYIWSMEQRSLGNFM